jgi:hypothetical protein
VKIQELKDALRATDPAAVLVSPRILSRVITKVHRLPTQFLPVPHRKTYVVDRGVLFRYVDQDDLGLASDQLLPPTVILLSRPTPEKSQPQGREAVLLRYWRRLFHASVHLILEKKFTEGQLSAADLRARIEQIGRTEFEEIRRVLNQDRYLLPPMGDREVYIEFAAVYLELRFFSSNLLTFYFPAIRDCKAIDLILAQDIDAPALFAAKRLPGAPEPVLRTDSNSDEPNEYYWKLVGSAQKAARAHNTVRAAILRTRAARVAPAALTLSTRAEAQADLQQLTERLRAALKLTEAEAAEWLKVLPALLEKADQGNWTIEARLLYDLQQVCIDREREIYTLDLVEWALSGGKRPIKRPLPSQRIVRITKHLTNATQRLTMARLSDTDRQNLAKLLQTALDRSEQRLRERFRPVLTDACHDVGLRPSNPPERTAFNKLIEELLDRVTEYGFLNFSDLRDAISRNQLKMPDLADPQEFVRGDPLLRLNRRLAGLMDGVYRPGEFYLRWLNRLTGLLFGTAVGRFLTLFLLVPFGGALLILEGLEVLVADNLHRVGVEFSFWPLVSFLPLGLFLLGLMHVPAVREGVAQAGRAVGRGLRTVFVDIPVRVVRIPALHRFVRSWPFQLVYWFLFKPLVVCGLIWLLVPGAFDRAWNAILTFVAVNFLLNSRLGHALNEAVVQGALQLFDWLRHDFFLGLYRLTVALFKYLTHLLEYLLFSVDEWLRFRGGESRFSMVVRAVLGVLWFPISYVIRLYTVVLIEPAINPIKLPLSILAAKFVYPLLALWGLFEIETMSSPLVPLLAPYIKYVPAWLLVIGTFYLLPDAFGFLFWELKENWKLYRANRPQNLRAVPIGRHGENMLQLLRPGLHSGTLPRLYAKLRWTEQEAIKTGIWRSARAYRHTLQEIEHAIRLFLERELVVLLRQSRSWLAGQFQVGRIGLASNRISTELCHADCPEEPVWVTFEEQAGWLVAGIPAPGWLLKLPQEPLQALVTALAGLYKLAGVGLVREQIQALLPTALTAYDIEEVGLVASLDQQLGGEVIYPLKGLTPQLKPESVNGQVGTAWPVLEAQRLIFAQVPLPWCDWVRTWEQDVEGKGHLPLLAAAQGLLPGTAVHARISDGPPAGDGATRADAPADVAPAPAEAESRAFSPGADHKA